MNNNINIFKVFFKLAKDIKKKIEEIPKTTKETKSIDTDKKIKTKK